jgi:hypothetical protein
MRKHWRISPRAKTDMSKYRRIYGEHTARIHVRSVVPAALQITAGKRGAAWS